MRRAIISILAGTSLAFAAAQPAAATVVVGAVGNVNINGFVVGNTANIKDSTALDFTDGATTGSAAGVLSGYVGNINGVSLLCSGTCGSIQDIASLTVGAQSIPLFFVLSGVGTGISFDLTSILAIDRSAAGKLAFDATGFLNAPGSTATPGVFSFTTQGPGLMQTTFSASTSAVPEPAAWTMMLLGFGAMSMAMRRRRRPALAQIA